MSIPASLADRPDVLRKSQYVSQQVIRRLAMAFAAMIAPLACPPPVGASVSEQPFKQASPADIERCSHLADSTLKGGAVVSAAIVADGAMIPARDGRPIAIARSDRTFCRVVVNATPAADARIAIEIWLPLDGNWNGGLFGTSNGGLEEIDYTELAGGIRRGFVTASMKLQTPVAIGPRIYRVGIDRPEFARNWSFRATHVMTDIAKQTLAIFYRRKHSLSLFAGVSGGGFQGFGEASRYPDDYDGIIVGGPSINYVNFGLAQGYRYLASHRTPTSSVPTNLLPLVADEVMAQCDGIDGLADRIIDDPRRCRANLKTLNCPGAQASRCLSPDQVAMLEAIYAGLRDPRTGKTIYPGFSPGAELSPGAAIRISGDERASFINDDTPGPLVWLLGANFSATRWSSIDFGGDGDEYRAAFAPYENAQLDFSAFAARGGKLIIYAGWAEANANPFDVVNYFEALEHQAGGKAPASRFARLFMVPGMYHHVGGPGPNIFGQKLSTAGSSPDDDLVMAMQRWITSGRAPDSIVATKYEDDKPNGRVLRKRPLCAFPNVALWNGHGTIDDAAQFDCVRR